MAVDDGCGRSGPLPDPAADHGSGHPGPGHRDRGRRDCHGFDHGRRARARDARLAPCHRGRSTLRACGSVEARRGVAAVRGVAARGRVRLGCGGRLGCGRLGCRGAFTPVATGSGRTSIRRGGGWGRAIVASLGDDGVDQAGFAQPLRALDAHLLGDALQLGDELLLERAAVGRGVHEAMPLPSGFVGASSNRR